MNLLFDFLKSRRSLRWLAHFLGLLAAAGATWINGFEFGQLSVYVAGQAVVLLVAEVLLGLLDFRARRLRKLAPTVFPLKNLGEEDRTFVQQALSHAPTNAAWRAALVWILFVPFAGLSGADNSVAWMMWLLGLGLPVTVMVQGWGNALMLKRVVPFFYFEKDYAHNLSLWLPKLAPRFRGALLAILVLVLFPFVPAFLLRQPLGLGVLVWIAGWGLIGVFGVTWALEALIAEPIQDLQQALHRFGQGDLQALLDVTSGDELGHATETYNKTLRAVDRRFFVLERFGHSVAPAKSEQLFEGGLRLDGELRAVAVLECAWQNVDAATKAQEPVARLATLNRFYEVVQDAVDKAHGSVLQASEGRVLACWGAPLMDEQAVQGALAAAWSLKAHLKVWASQQFLRGGSAVQWGLGIASGQATVGLVGPKGRQRYSILGGPVSEVRGLAQREAGPWLDERSAGAAKSPFAVQILEQGAQLIAGPEPEAPSAADLGFSPGEKL